MHIKILDIAQCWKQGVLQGISRLVEAGIFLQVKKQDLEVLIANSPNTDMLKPYGVSIDGVHMPDDERWWLDKVEEEARDLEDDPQKQMMEQIDEVDCVCVQYGSDTLKLYYPLR
jgi:hypothetical protein